MLTIFNDNKVNNDNFDVIIVVYCFLGINNSVAYEKFILGTSEQTAKIFKTSFTKIWHTAVSNPQWVGFSSTKTDCNKFESWEKFFSVPWLVLFLTRTNQVYSPNLRHLKNNVKNFKKTATLLLM